MVRRELQLPARPDALLGARHHPGVVDQDVDGATRIEEALRKGADAVLVGKVELVDLNVVDALESLLGHLATTRGNDDVGACANKRLDRLETQPRIAAGHDRELAAQVDAGNSLGSGRAIAKS